MKTVIFGVVMLLSQLGTQAAPSCVPGTLQSYFDLGTTGCELGIRSFSNFRLGQRFLPAMDLSVVNVTPAGTTLYPSLIFTPNYVAGPGEEYALLFQFVVTGTLTGVTLKFDSPATSGDGVVTAFVDVCPGALYTPYAPFDCATGSLPYLSAYASRSSSATPHEYVPTPTVSFYDVSLHLYLDGRNGQTGTASLNSANIGFELVSRTPEPAVTPLILTGLALIGLRRYRHRRNCSLPQTHS